MMIEFNYRIIIFPPLYIYKSIQGIKNDNKKLCFSKIFFVGWVTCQWLLMFLSSKNIIMNIINAHVSIIGFLIGNLFLQLDIRKYSSEDIRFLKSLPVLTIVAAGTIAFMYAFVNIPIIALGSLEKFIKLYSIANISIWSTYHSVVGICLIISWLIFVIVNKSEIFSLFPRNDKAILWSLKLGKIGKLWILLFYLIVFLVFVDMLRGGNVIFFITR